MESIVKCLTLITSHSIAITVITALVHSTAWPLYLYPAVLLSLSLSLCARSVARSTSWPLCPPSKRRTSERRGDTERGRRATVVSSSSSTNVHSLLVFVSVASPSPVRVQRIPPPLSREQDRGSNQVQK